MHQVFGHLMKKTSFLAFVDAHCRPIPGTGCIQSLLDFQRVFKGIYNSNEHSLFHVTILFFTYKLKPLWRTQESKNSQVSTPAPAAPLGAIPYSGQKTWNCCFPRPTPPNCYRSTSFFRGVTSTAWSVNPTPAQTPTQWC